jgi:hypothetical protein
MTVKGYDILSDYQNYDTGFQPMQSRATRPQANGSNGYQMASQGLQAAGGASAALPWVSAGLSAAGLLSSLYGGYKAQESAEKNYRDQMREFERQKAIEEEDRQRRIKEEALKSQMAVSQFGSEQDQNRMAQYSPYYRSIGR